MPRVRKNTNMYRVTQYQYWPAERGTTHNAKYFDSFDKARTFYLQRCIDQISEVRLLEYVALEVFNAPLNKYFPIFESHQRHTVESYGLDPND